MNLRPSNFRFFETFLGAGGGVLIVALILVGLGSMFIYSASFRPQLQTYLPYASKQLLWAGISLVVFFLIVFIDYTYLLKYAFFIYALGVFALVLTAIIGTTQNAGARRWIRIGPMLIQTSEFVKLGLILVLAKYLRYQKDFSSYRSLIVPFIITLIPLGLILKQPDLGTSLVLVPILFSMLLVAGIPIKRLLLIIFLLLNCIPLAFFFLHDYQRNRVFVFIYQDSLSTEQQRREGYHLMMSKIAIGTGGLTGEGLGKGGQTKGGFLPARQTDFIFAVIGEESGFLGSTFVLAMFFTMLLLILGIAETTREPGGRLIVIGIATLIATHVMVNVAMTMGLAPITGIPLPFLSYGGSSLLFAFTGLGLVVGVHGHKVAFLESSESGSPGILHQ